MLTGRERILRACYSFLVPLVRFVLRSGISNKEFSELTRMAFVEVARQDYGIRGRPTNISRISAMTGIGRKEVRRVQQLIETFDRDPRLELSPLSDILHRWHTDANYLTENGTPRILTLHTGNRSFAQLVRECAGDVPIGAIKVELVRCGAVREDSFGNVEAVRRYVVPEDVDDKLIASMVFGLRGLASTIAFNSDPMRSGSPRFERIVQSDPIAPDRKEEIRASLEQRLERFTEEVDDLFASSTVSVSSGERVAIGVFYYEDQ